MAKFFCGTIFDPLVSSVVAKCEVIVIYNLILFRRHLTKYSSILSIYSIKCNQNRSLYFKNEYGYFLYLGENFSNRLRTKF